MGAFAKVANGVIADWAERLEDQRARLSKKIPSSNVESAARATELLDKLKAMSYQLGYGMRKERVTGVSRILPREPGDPGVPGREIVIDLPSTKKGWYDPRLASKEAGLLSAITDPIGEQVEETSLDLQRAADEKMRQATRVTASPHTLPWFYPAAALTVPKAFSQGYQTAEQEVDARETHDLNRRLQKAKKEFEQALEDEYAESRKAASAGELVDGLAQLHVKAAEDYNLNTALGVYLALASLAGTGAHNVSKSWAEKRDPRYQRLEALQQAMQKRMRAKPPRVVVAAPEQTLEEKSPDLGI